MPKPTFMVIGAAKCGTTSICDLIAGHPDVFVTSPKEPHYFSRIGTYERKRAWYESLFEGTERFKARGEGSTSYTHPNRIDFVVPRLREVVPECRLIYMVRHPIRRLESDWRMRRYENRIHPSINAAVDEAATLLLFGLYWKRLSAYRALFSDEQILIVFLEDLANEPRREVSRVLDHIGVDPEFEPDEPERPRNSARKYRRDGALAATLRSLPGLGMVKRRLPDGVLATARRWLTREYRPVASWDPGILDAVQRHYREDAAALLDYCGKPREFWDLSSSVDGAPDPVPSSRLGRV